MSNQIRPRFRGIRLNSILTPIGVRGSDRYLCPINAVTEEVKYCFKWAVTRLTRS
jgi:hypothetical protein